MTHIPIKHLTRAEVEKLADEYGPGSFARQALLEADFMNAPVRFILFGTNRLVVQRLNGSDIEEDPED